MIQITLKDSLGNDVVNNDVVALHYPNQKVKYIGVLLFDEKDARFILTDLNKKEQPFKGINWIKSEKLCNVNDAPELKNHLGYHDSISIKKFAAIKALIPGHVNRIDIED